MAVLIEDINTKMWSLKVSQVGAIVADIEDLKQSIMLIVLTVKGTVPFLPEFGCGLYNYIDQPAQAAAPLMVREIRNAVTRWETRATVLNTSYTIDLSTINISLELRPNFFREQDPAGSVFVGFELDMLSGTILFLTDQFGRPLLTDFGPIKIMK